MIVLCSAFSSRMELWFLNSGIRVGDDGEAGEFKGEWKTVINSTVKAQ
jgi:hypothetical protein